MGFFDCWHLYLLSSWNNCFLFKTLSISKLKYWITVHSDSLEISSREAHFSIFLTFKENELKHAAVYISATSKLFLQLNTLYTAFQKEMSFEKKRSRTSLPATNNSFLRAVFPNYPFLSSSPSSCLDSSTFQPSYSAVKSLGKSGPHT